MNAFSLYVTSSKHCRRYLTAFAGVFRPASVRANVGVTGAVFLRLSE
jgi:hypothetical protein